MTSPEIVPYKDRCWFCRKRKATLLCDYVVCEVWTSIDFQTHAQTCDRHICDKCATHLGGATHFCPKHAREAKERLKSL